MSLVLCLLSAAGCQKGIYKKKYAAAGTILEVTSPDKRAAKIVYDEFRRLEKIFNLYDSKSELSRLNETFNTPFDVSPEMIEVIDLAKQVYEYTDGSFDVSCGEIYRFWKEVIAKKNISKLPPKSEIDKLKELCGMRFIDINKDAKTIAIRKKGLKIDLGGIAKGYMADKAVQKLKEHGIESALINAGGDIYCLGTNGNNFWRVGIKNPEELLGLLETQELANEAIATSGNYEQFFELEGRRYSHIIDPVSGYPVENSCVSVTVVNKNCSSADALATAFFVMGKDAVRKTISRTPSTMKVFVLTDEKEGKRLHFIR
ncbi:MAG: FAD:protein FMN transferase [Candidatus Omnitrophota bacterium]